MAEQTRSTSHSRFPRPGHFQVQADGDFPTGDDQTGGIRSSSGSYSPGFQPPLHSMDGLPAVSNRTGSQM
jgi:hypothetical protein